MEMVRCGSCGHVQGVTSDKGKCAACGIRGEVAWWVPVDDDPDPAMTDCFAAIGRLAEVLERHHGDRDKTLGIQAIRDCARRQEREWAVQMLYDHAADQRCQAAGIADDVARERHQFAAGSLEQSARALGDKAQPKDDGKCKPMSDVMRLQARAIKYLRDQEQHHLGKAGKWRDNSLNGQFLKGRAAEAYHAAVHIEGWTP